MKSKLLGPCAAVAALFLSVPSFGVTLDLAVSSVEAIRSPEGGGRVLFKIPELSGISGKLVTAATLEIPVGIRAAARDVDLYVFAVDRSWSPGSATWSSPWRRAGGEWGLDHYGLAHVRAGEDVAVLSFDVSTLVRAIVDGESSPFGFIVSAGPAEGVGRIGESELGLLESAQGAKLRVSYLEVSRRHP